MIANTAPDRRKAVRKAVPTFNARMLPVTQTYEFLVARAEEAAIEAKTASLDNVKKRALRSEAAWRGMADRTLKLTREREKVRLGKEKRSPALTGLEIVTADVEH